MAGEDLNSVKVEITIDGKECDFLTLNLHQTMFGHHIFSIDLNYRAKKLDVWTQTPEQILKQLGNDVFIRISDRVGNTTEFEGVIKKVNISGKHSGQGVVTIYGGSPTLLMTDDYSMNTFVDTDLASIVHETVTDLGLKIEHKIEPAYNDTIPFVYRYKESSYDFLRRLLNSCGEWFYYDGKKIVVGFSKEQGKKDIENAIPLTFRDDLEELDVSSTLGNYDIEQYDYNPALDKVRQYPSYPKGRNLDTFTSPAFKKSKTIYKDYTVLPSRMAIRSGGTYEMMTNAVAADHFSKLYNGALLTAKTRSCTAALGKVVFVESEKEEGSEISDYDRELGDFRIIEVNHTYDNGKKSYENNIVGVNAWVNTVPSRDVKWPTALPEVATVMDNKDPENMGRVKVQYMWQRLDDHPQGKTSGWMRVQTPDAGSSEVVEKNRGFFFVPEVGDQVMVNYEYGDPDRPFVAGSLFHVNNTQGTTSDNILKSIITQSGHTLQFNDGKGDKWGIVIKDEAGNIIHLNTYNKNIELTSPNSIHLNSKEIALVGDTISLKAADSIINEGDNLVSKATNKMSLVGNKVNVLGYNQLSTYGGQNLILGKQNVEIGAPQISTKSSGHSESPSKVSDRTSTGQKTTKVAEQQIQASDSKAVQINKKEDKEKAITEQKQMNQVRHNFYTDYASWVEDFINMLNNWYRDVTSSHEDQESDFTTYSGWILQMFPDIISTPAQVLIFLFGKIDHCISALSKVSCEDFCNNISDALTQIKNGAKQGEKSCNVAFFSVADRNQQYLSFLQYAKEHGADTPDNYTAKLDLFFKELRAKYAIERFYRDLTILWIKSSIDSWDYDNYSGEVEIMCTKVTNEFWTVNEFYIDDVSNPKGVIKALNSNYFDYGKRHIFDLPIPIRLRLLPDAGAFNKLEGRYRRDSNIKGRWQPIDRVSINTALLNDFLNCAQKDSLKPLLQISELKED